MNATLWTQIRETFSELVELSPAERASRLNRLEPDLRNGVEGLLSAHDAAGPFLEPATEPVPGTRLGPYRLVERIGEGGMGVVYRAARDDGEFRREVAIKVVGGRLLAPEAERRFIQERQILARLDHLNIVRMLDGGVSEGRRFLAMEYVKGEPITSFCGQHDLPLAKRLHLFLDLAAAVHCAHQNLIIHRDLKATNVLVTEDGVVKVLDFGIAQLLETNGHDSASRTGTNPWTLACASPEQLMGAPLTVATDIYSLGVLLYELLTGVNPQWSSVERVDETFSRICEREAKPPSQINRAVPRDLDAIVLKTLAKAPPDRFGSVEELRADIQRFLDGRPVLAQPPSAAYRLRKMVQRNKLLSAVSAGLILAVLGGLVAFAWQAQVAEQQRVIVERRFNEARRLIRTVIADIQPKMAAIAGTASVRKSLIDSTLSYLEALERDAAGNADLIRELAESYVELGVIQGNSQFTNLGDPAAAAVTLEKARSLVDQLLRTEPDNPESLRVAIRCDRALLDLNNSRGDRSKAQAFGKRAVEESEKLVGLKPGDDSAQKTLAASMLHLSIATKSLQDYQRALRAHESLLLRQSADPQLRRNIALIHKYLSGLYLTNTDVEKRDKKKALDHALSAMQIDEKLLSESPGNPQAQLDFAIDLSQVGGVYRYLGDLPNASSFMQRSVEIREGIVRENPDDIRAQDRLAYALSQQAYYHGELGDSKAALADFIRTVSIYDRLYARKAVNTQMISQYAYSHYRIGSLLQQVGKAPESCSHYARSALLYQEREKMGTLTEDDLYNLPLVRAAVAACKPLPKKIPAN